MQPRIVFNNKHSPKIIITAKYTKTKLTLIAFYCLANKIFLLSNGKIFWFSAQLQGNKNQYTTLFQANVVCWMDLCVLTTAATAKKNWFNVNKCFYNPMDQNMINWLLLKETYCYGSVVVSGDFVNRKSSSVITNLLKIYYVFRAAVAKKILCMCIVR